MAKNWYPIIDYDKCIECSDCVDMCTHGVYDKDKAPKPQVVFGEGCVQGCKGCGNICPSQAITYFGDNDDAAGCDCIDDDDCGDDCACHDDDSDCGDDCACHDDDSDCGDDCGCNSNDKGDNGRGC